MKPERDMRIPLSAMALLKLSSALVPPPRRWEWSQEWHSELWYARREWAHQGCCEGQAWRRSVQFCLGAFSDALWLRRDQFSSPVTLFDSAQRNDASLLCLLAMVVFLAFALPGSRRAMLTSSRHQQANLVSISRSGVTKSDTPTIALAEYRRWEKRGRNLFSEMAFYTVVEANEAAIGPKSASIGVASTEFAKLVDLQTSSDVMDRARAVVEPVLVVAESYRTTYMPEVSAGDEVTMLGRRVLFAGVIPDHAPGLAGQQDAWLLVDDTQLEQVTGSNAGFVVAQVSAKQRAAGYTGRWGFSSVENGDSASFDCVPLRNMAARPSATFLFALFLALLALPATTPLPLGEYPAASHPLFHRVRWRRWVFLGVKIGLSVAIVYFASMLLAFGIINAGSESSELIQLGSSFVGLLFSLRWALRDQRLRCPVCLRLLRSPARVGYASRSFLAWHGTEFMCEQGHGLLHVPEVATSWFSTQRWLMLDASWVELFSGG